MPGASFTGAMYCYSLLKKVLLNLFIGLLFHILGTFSNKPHKLLTGLKIELSHSIWSSSNVLLLSVTLIRIRVCHLTIGWNGTKRLTEMNWSTPTNNIKCSSWLATAGELLRAARICVFLWSGFEKPPRPLTTHKGAIWKQPAVGVPSPSRSRADAKASAATEPACNEAPRTRLIGSHYVPCASVDTRRVHCSLTPSL